MPSLLRPHLTPGRIALLYAGFAALWIITSDGLLSLAIDDPALLAKLSFTKGVAFIGVTAGLLYLLLCGWRESEGGDGGTLAMTPKPQPRLWVLVLVGLALLAPLLGFVIVRLHGPQLEQEAYINLQTIAELKADQIAHWLDERQSDGEVLVADTTFARQVDQFLRQNDLSLRGDLLHRLEGLRTVYRYEGVVLLDLTGRPVMTCGDHAGVAPSLQPLWAQALASGQVQRSDLYRDETGQIHLDWVVPIALAESEGRRVVATVVLHTAPQDFLFPLIQRWPTPSSSAESLLVRREGESVVFLNERRHHPDAALTDRLPSNLDLPASVAVRAGQAGTIHGVDYHGVSVLAAFRPVAGSDWHLVAKIDYAEVMAPLNHLVFWVSVVALFAVAAVTASVLLLWRQQQRTHRFELLAQAAEQDRLLRKFYDLPFVGMALTSPESQRWLQCNDRLCEMLGYPREQLANMTWTEITHPDDLSADVAEYERVLRGDSEGYSIDKRFIRKDGAVVLTTLDVKSLRRADGTVEFFIATVNDITERKQAEERLRQAATVFENTHEGITITDADEHILRVNRAFCELTGYSEEEVQGQTPRLLHSGRHDRDFYAAMWASIDHTGHWQDEIWNRRKNGEVYPALLSISAVKNAAGVATHYVGVLTDLSQIKDSEAQLNFLAHYDPLTGLPNRLLLSSRLQHSIDVARRDGTALALLMLDLDHFKRVNEIYGHLAGDTLLQQVAERLTGRLHGVDTVTRLGGDEFAVLLEDMAQPQDAARVALEIIDLLSEPWHLANGIEVRLGASLGISLFPDHGQTAEELLQQADTALYQAKNEGRGNFQYFSADLTQAARQRIELEARLRRAIDEGQLRVYYQPQVDIPSGRIVGAEALVRWQDPEHGLIPPGRFIPLAEETGLISALGAWVLRETCRQGKVWLDAGWPPLTLAVNLSAHQLRQGDLVATVMQVLGETGFPAEWLELELTESALMLHEAEAVTILERLRGLGLRLAMDDFGTGYSSLAYLKRFPLDVLKIDKSFVDDLPQQRDAMEIAATIIAMGHTLGLKVLAEGVETAEQLTFLQLKGCDQYQGYLTSPPVPAAAFVALLTPLSG